MATSTKPPVAMSPGTRRRPVCVPCPARVPSHGPALAPGPGLGASQGDTKHVCWIFLTVVFLLDNCSWNSCWLVGLFVCLQKLYSFFFPVFFFFFFEERQTWYPSVFKSINPRNVLSFTPSVSSHYILCKRVVFHKTQGYKYCTSQDQGQDCIPSVVGLCNNTHDILKVISV